MKEMIIKIKGFILLAFLMLLIAPIIQKKLSVFELAPLKGAIVQIEDNNFSFKGWLSGEYQLQKENFINESFGFRSIFIRINNQIAFNLFNKAKANGVIIGKDNYLFEENYIKAYFGEDFIGVDSITKRIQQLKFIQDTLSTMHKNVIVVFAAGKASFYPEYIPNNRIVPKGKTNFEYHVKLAKDLGLNYIDFNTYFVDNKTNSKYPLYPQYGIHWSYYGMCLAADSIIRYIENKRSIDMPNLFWDNIEMAAPRETDYDIADGMNLNFKLKSFEMAYPNIQIQTVEGKTKPSVLVVSDSYYWGMFGFGFTKAFSNNHFWFYNKQIYPDSFEKPLETSQINLQAEIDRHDIIILMATEATLPSLGWGFIENTYDLFKGNIKDPNIDIEFQKKVTALRNYIKTDKNWMEQIAKKAVAKKISADSMLTIDAIWQIQQNEK